MKKFVLCLVTCVSLTLLPVRINANAPFEPLAATTSNTNTKNSEEAKALENRLYEIKAMDLSKMKTSEKKQMRKEVKSINRRLHDISGGVYVSAGAIIVVLIILLVLL